MDDTLVPGGAEEMRAAANAGLVGDSTLGWTTQIASGLGDFAAIESRGRDERLVAVKGDYVVSIETSGWQSQHDLTSLMRSYLAPLQ